MHRCAADISTFIVGLRVLGNTRVAPDVQQCMVHALALQDISPRWPDYGRWTSTCRMLNEQARRKSKLTSGGAWLADAAALLQVQLHN